MGEQAARLSDIVAGFAFILLDVYLIVERILGRWKLVDDATRNAEPCTALATQQAVRAEQAARRIGIPPERDGEVGVRGTGRFTEGAIRKVLALQRTGSGRGSGGRGAIRETQQRGKSNFSTAHGLVAGILRGA